MTPIEEWLFWITVSLYGAASVAFMVGVIFRRGRLIRWGIFISVAGFVAQNATIGVRWSATGHAPIIGDYENTLAASWIIMGLFLGLQLRFTALKSAGIAVVPFSLLMLGYGAFRSPTLEPLTPVFLSPWLFIHIAFAWVAYGSFVLAAGLAFLFLLRTRKNGGGKIFSALPATEVMELLTYRLIFLGFVADSVMLVAGAIWSNNLWGSYWSWDPVQTWSLLSWLIYGTYLHLRVVHGWRGKRAAWLALVALPTVIISFFGISFVTAGWHVF